MGSVSENVKHAYKMGLAPIVHGEDHTWATISEATAIRIIELLLTRRYTQQQIADMCNTTKSVVQAIAIKNSWAHLTKSIDMKKKMLHMRVPKKFSMEQMEAFCKYFSDVPINDGQSEHNYFIQALNFFNIEVNDNNIHVLYNLYRRNSYKELSDKYDF